jgi:hypothetical protein
MLLSNLLIAIAITTLWPLGLLGLLAACDWLERRTLVPMEVVPRLIKRMESKPPEAVEAMVLEETAQVVAAYWSSTGRPLRTGDAPAASGRRQEDLDGQGSEPAPEAEAEALPEAEAEAVPEPAGRVPVQQRQRAVVPGRAARLGMRRRPGRGRHERR